MGFESSCPSGGGKRRTVSCVPWALKCLYSLVCSSSIVNLWGGGGVGGGGVGGGGVGGSYYRLAPFSLWNLCARKIESDRVSRTINHIMIKSKLLTCKVYVEITWLDAISKTYAFDVTYWGYDDIGFLPLYIPAVRSSLLCWHGAS